MVGSTYLLDSGPGYSSGQHRVESGLSCACIFIFCAVDPRKLAKLDPSGVPPFRRKGAFCAPRGLARVLWAFRFALPCTSNNGSPLAVVCCNPFFLSEVRLFPATRNSGSWVPNDAHLEDYYAAERADGWTRWRR